MEGALEELLTGGGSLNRMLLGADGKPVIRGTRLAVEFIVELPANGWTERQIIGSYPGIC